MNHDLSGRAALVFGGSYGIGAAVAARLAACGANVAVNGRHPRPEALVPLQASGREALFVVGDMTRYEDVQRAVAQTVDRFGRLDAVVVSGKPNTAAAGLFVETDPATFAEYFTARTLTRFYAARAAAEVMRRQGKGKIVFLTTDAGRTPTPAESLIGASAAAVIFGTRAIAREVARFGIRVNTVALTLTRNTPVYEEYRRQLESGAVIWKAFERIEQMAAFGLNRPEDVAELVLFLCADASDQISGATISINGGVSFPG